MTERTTGRKQSDELNVLLVAGNRSRAALLRQAMERAGVACLLRRIDPGRAAVTYARRAGVYRRMPEFHVIFVDAAELDTDVNDTLKSLLGGVAAAPLVLLTRPASETQLTTTGIVDVEHSVFAPCELEHFLAKMRDHRRRRFLKALNVMNLLGPVLVRLPCAMSGRRLHADELLSA